MVEVNLENPTGNSFKEVSLIGSTNPSTQRSDEMSGFLSVLFSVATGEAQQNVRDRLSIGFEDNLKASARFKNETAISSTVRERLLTGEDIDVTSTSEVVDTVRNSSVPEMDSLVLTGETSAFEETDRRIVHRAETLKRLFQDKLDKSSGGFLAGAGYFVDLVLSTPKDVIFGGGFTRSNMAEKLRNLLTRSDVSEDEFQIQAAQFLDEVADIGFFSEENWFYTQALIDDYINGGSGWDKFFTVVDATGVGAAVGKTAKGARALLRARDAADYLQRAVSRQAAQNATLRGQGVEVARQTAPTSTSPMHPHRAWLAGPGTDSLRRIEQNNTVLETVRSLDWGGFIREEVFEEARPRILEELEKRFSFASDKRYIDHDVRVTDFGGNLLGTVVFGKAKGGLYETAQGAQRYANEIGGEVVTRLDGGVEKFAVVKEVNISNQGLANATTEDSITTNIFNKLTSPFLTTNQTLDAILKRGEGQLGVIQREIAREFRSAANKVSRKERKIVDQVYSQFRDGARAHHRRPFTDQEFRDEYYRLTNSRPKQSVVEYHRKVQELNDTTYFITANRYFRDAVDRGEEIININGLEKRVVTQKVDDISENRQIFDVDNNKVLTPKEAQGRSVFAVNGGYDFDNKLYRYIVTSSPKTRRLFHDDVLNYNVGGPRIYKDFKNFVKQESTLKFADGAVSGRPITFLGTITQKEARKAVDEINTIFDFLKTKGVQEGSVFNALQVIRSLSGDGEFLKVLRANNTWNPELETVEEFVEFLERYKLDPGKSVGLASDGELMRKVSDDGIESYVSGFNRSDETYGDQFIKASNVRSRRDDPLLEFGGKKPVTFGPTQAIERSFARAINGQAEDAYIFNAVNGWLKGAAPYITNANEIAGKRPYQAMTQAKLGKVKEARAYDQERAVIQRRVETDNWFTKWWSGTVEDFADFVYDKGFKKAGVGIRNVFSPDPTIALRSFAFDLKLGLFALPQLFVQSTQAVNILAIAGTNGMRGAASYFPLRMALANGNPKVIEEIGRRAGPFLGMKKEEFVELTDFIKRSGRDIVDNTVIEQNKDFEFALGISNRIRQAGRFFFYEGELGPRLAAATASYLEFRKAFPKVSLESQQAVEFMTRRMDVLTAGMTRASSTAWQRDSLLSVPLQFMSYTSRMMEQLLSGRILTKAERARLAIIQLSMWGATGYGLGSQLNWLVNEGHVSINHDNYRLLRYGALDYVLGEATGSRTAFAERLAFGEGFFDLYEKITDDKFLEVIAGPSGSIAKDVFSQVQIALGDVIHGRFNLLTVDIQRVLRNVSGLNSTTQAYIIAKTGEYYSRNANNIIATELGTSDAIMTMIGAPLQDVSSAYDLLDLQRDKKQHLNDIGGRLADLMNVVRNKVRDDDLEGAKAILEDMSVLIGVLDPHERPQVMSFLKKGSMSLLEETILKQLKQAGDNNLAKLLATREDG